MLVVSDNNKMKIADAGVAGYCVLGFRLHSVTIFNCGTATRNSCMYRNE